MEIVHSRVPVEPTWRTKKLTAVFILFLMILLMSYPKCTKLNNSEELLNTSDFILSKHWKHIGSGCAE